MKLYDPAVFKAMRRAARAAAAAEGLAVRRAPIFTRDPGKQKAPEWVAWGIMAVGLFMAMFMEWEISPSTALEAKTFCLVGTGVSFFVVVFVAGFFSLSLTSGDDVEVLRFLPISTTQFFALRYEFARNLLVFSMILGGGVFASYAHRLGCHSPMAIVAGAAFGVLHMAVLGSCAIAFVVLDKTRKGGFLIIAPFFLFLVGVGVCSSSPGRLLVPEALSTPVGLGLLTASPTTWAFVGLAELARGGMNWSVAALLGASGLFAILGRRFVETARRNFETIDLRTLVKDVPTLAPALRAFFVGAPPAPAPSGPEAPSKSLLDPARFLPRPRHFLNRIALAQFNREDRILLALSGDRWQIPWRISKKVILYGVALLAFALYVGAPATGMIFFPLGLAILIADTRIPLLKEGAAAACPVDFRKIAFLKWRYCFAKLLTLFLAALILVPLAGTLFHRCDPWVAFGSTCWIGLGLISAIPYGILLHWEMGIDHKGFLWTLSGAPIGLLVIGHLFSLFIMSGLAEGGVVHLGPVLVTLAAYAVLPPLTLGLYAAVHIRSDWPPIPRSASPHPLPLVFERLGLS